MSLEHDILAALVACPSPSGAEEAIIQLTLDIAHDLGLVPERVGGSLLLRTPNAGDKTRVLFASHLDTVPAGEGWTRDPYDARWNDGKLYGRGSNDAKASVAAMMTALASVRGTGAARGVVVALNACEETTNHGMEEVLAHIDPPEMAVVGEPTGLEVVRAQGGLVVLEAEWHGMSCHAAHAAHTEHRNALMVGASDLQAFGTFLSLDAHSDVLGPTTIVPTQFQSGERHNVVPDRARAVFDARVSPPHDAETCVKALAERMPAAKINVRSKRLRAIETPAEHPLVSAALSAAGRQAAIGSNTLSDMALLAAGTPAVKCGPGDTLRSHKPDEYVCADELRAGTAFYAKLMTLIQA